MEIIYALWLRQIKRYFRSKSRIVGSLAQPILFLVALGFGLNPVFQKAGAGNYIEFLAPGIIAMSILFTSVFSGIEVIWDKEFGFLKETLVAPVSRMEIMIGRTLGGASVAVLQGTIVLVITFFAGFKPNSFLSFPAAILCMLLIALTFTALGTAIASVLDDMQGFQLIMNFLVMPLFFLSGALFPLQGLPVFLKVITSVDPLTFGVDGLRGVLTGLNHYPVSLDFLILGSIALILLGIGSYLFSKIEI
jgi:ABC-2 type transport system permease protein